MHYLNLSVACLSLTIATFTTFGMIIPKAQASSNQSLQLQAQTPNWFLQGIQKANQQDYQGALLDFTQAIQINHQHAEAYYQRGLIYAQYAQGKPLNPDGTVPGCKRIDDYRIICPVEVKDRIKENKQRAIADFSQAIKINPQYAAAYYQRGLLQESEAKKLEDFQTAVDNYLKTSLVNLHQNNYQQAANCLETIEQIHAEQKVLTTSPGTGNQKLDENPVNSPTISPDRKKSPESLMNEAHQTMRRGDLKAALNIYRKAALIFQEKKDPRYQEVQQIIAEIEQIAYK